MELKTDGNVELSGTFSDSQRAMMSQTTMKKGTLINHIGLP
jgi:hypothetical protein